MFKNVKHFFSAMSHKRIHFFVVTAGTAACLFFFNNCQKFTPASGLVLASDLFLESSLSVNLEGRPIFSCDPSIVSKTPVLKLTNREFKAALFALVDDFAPNPSSPLSVDANLNTLVDSISSDNLMTGRFALKEQNFLETQLTASRYFEASFKAAALVAYANVGLGNYPNTAGCLNNSSVTQSCHQSFVRELGSRAFRRNLSVADGNSLATIFWDSSLAKTDLIQLTFTGIVQSPDFLYRTYDQGAPSSRGPRVLNLTAEELASKLSFFLTGKAPDSTLRSLASSGQILNNATLAQQVDRLLASTDSKSMLQRLFKESYGYDHFDVFNYSSEFLSGVNPANLINAMIQEMDSYFPDMIISKNATFRDLMTSQNSNITDPNLALVYGLSSAPGPTTLPADRSGFLNRAAFLAKKSGNYTSPVRRGLSVLENVLCVSIGNPPPNAPTAVPEVQVVNEYLTTRERYTHLSQVAGTSCVSCHSRMNSIGYAFEGFDSLGRSRSMERIFTSATSPVITSLAVDTQSSIPDLHSAITTVRNSTDLALDLGNNDKAMMCFVKHLKDFESRTTASSADGCQMNSSLNVLYGLNGNQGTVQQAIKSLILSKDFKIWSY